MNQFHDDVPAGGKHAKSSARDQAGTLDDESLAMLLDEVIAMVRAGRPLTAGLADLDDRALGKVGRAARTMRQSLDQGRNVSDSMAALSLQYQSPLTTAMQIMMRTGSTTPMHETVRLIRQSTEERRQLRLRSIGPLLNLLVGATVVFCVIPWILVTLSEAELIKTALSPTVRQICETFATNAVLALIVTLVVVGLLTWLFYGVLKTASAGAGRLKDHATFCRWLAMQIGPDHNGNESQMATVVSSAAEVVGPTFAESWAPTVDRIQSGAVSQEALSIPVGTPDPVATCVQHLVAGSARPETIALDLTQLGELFSQQYHQHRSWWVDRFPFWVTGTLLVIMIIVLLRVILMPIFDVIGDLI